MGTLNKIPKTGTFGTAVDAMNDNFTLIEQSLAEGYSPYQVWLDQGNEGTEQDFLDSLKGNPGTYIDPANTEIFDNISDLEGKTAAQKEAMIPDGGVAEEIALLKEELTCYSLNNKYINENGFVVQPSPGNEYFNVDVYDISAHAGKRLNFGTVKGATQPYAWAIYTTTSVGTTSAVRIMAEQSSASGAFTKSLTIQQGDMRLAVVRYKEGAHYANVTHPVKDRVNENSSAIASVVNQVEDLQYDLDHITDPDVLLSKENYSTTTKQNYHYINAEGDVAGTNNWGGSAGGKARYFVTEFVDVSDIGSLVYRFEWSTSTVNAVVIAAYDENKEYISANSVPRVLNGVAEGLWVKGEDTKYVRFSVYYNNGATSYYAINPDTLGNTLSLLREDIDSIVDFAGNNIVALNRDRDGIVANMTGTTTLGLLHFSDLHYDPANMQRIMDWYDEHSDSVDDIINTGDTVNSHYGTALGYGSVAGVEKILNTIGNHDIDSDGGGHYSEHTGLDGYNTYIKPFVANWGVTQPSDAESVGKCYYYKDYTSKGIRLVVLDTIAEYFQGSAQQTWFQGVLADAITNDLAVVVASHWMNIDRIAVKTHFASWNRFSASAPAGSAKVAEDVQTFIDGGGEFVCHLIGHSHTDFIGTLDGYSSQLCIMVGAANGSWASGNNYAVDHGGGEVRVPNTRSQDSFNVYGINVAGHWIDIVKIGVDSNSMGQKKDFLRIDYHEKKEVFTNFTGGGGEQVQADWNQSDNSQPDYIKNKPTIPTVPTKVSVFDNDAGYLTNHQDISGKEDRVAVASISGTALAAEVGKYYVGASVETLAVTLPTVADATHLASVVLNIATGSSPAVTFTAESGVTISYSKDFALEASKEYEVNCLWQGTKWIIMAVEVETPS